MSSGNAAKWIPAFAGMTTPNGQRYLQPWRYERVALSLDRPLAARLVGLQVSEDDAQERRRDALGAAAAYHVADDVRGLDRAAALDVAQHRGAEGRRLVGQPAAHRRVGLLARRGVVG